MVDGHEPTFSGGARNPDDAPVTRSGGRSDGKQRENGITRYTPVDDWLYGPTMRMGHILTAVALCATTARADDVHNRVGLAFVAAAETTSAQTAGFPGGQLELAHWHGPVALVVEGAHVRDSDSDGGSWGGAGARMVLGSVQMQHGPDWLRLTGWTQVGAAREVWELRDGGSIARNHVHAGLGITALGGRQAREIPIGAQLWFRVQRADAPGSDMDDVPARTNMILGLGLLLGL